MRGVRGAPSSLSQGATANSPSLRGGQLLALAIGLPHLLAARTRLGYLLI